MTLQQKLEERTRILTKLTELTQEPYDLEEEKKVGDILLNFEKAQHVDDSIITDLLSDNRAVSVKREAELGQAALYWKAESEKWKAAYAGFRFQNRV